MKKIILLFLLSCGGEDSKCQPLTSAVTCAALETRQFCGFLCTCGSSGTWENNASCIRTGGSEPVLNDACQSFEEYVTSNNLICICANGQCKWESR